jgi:hypothetical protein
MKGMQRKKDHSRIMGVVTPRQRRRRFALTVISVGLTVAALASPFVVSIIRERVALGVTDDHGQEVGVLAKLSHKGWVCKTWEGELITRGHDRVIPSRFFFTVRNPQVVQTMQSHMGRMLIVDYVQHPISAPSCFGDTQYFVDDAGPIRLDSTRGS